MHNTHTHTRTHKDLNLSLKRQQAVVHLLMTKIQQKTFPTIFPLISQKVIAAQILSTGVGQKTLSNVNQSKRCRMNTE